MEIYTKQVTSIKTIEGKTRETTSKILDTYTKDVLFVWAKAKYNQKNIRVLTISNTKRKLKSRRWSLVL